MKKAPALMLFELLVAVVSAALIILLLGDAGIGAAHVLSAAP